MKRYVITVCLMVSLLCPPLPGAVAEEASASCNAHNMWSQALAPASGFQPTQEESAMAIILRFLDGMRRRVAELRLLNAAFLLLDRETGQAWALEANHKRISALSPLDAAAVGLLEYTGKSHLFFPLRGITFAERLAVIFVAAEKERKQVQREPPQSEPFRYKGPMLSRRFVLDWGARITAAVAWGDTHKILSLAGSAVLPTREDILKLGQAIVPELTRLQELGILRTIDLIFETGPTNYLFTGFLDEPDVDESIQQRLSGPPTSADISAQPWAEKLCAQAIARGAARHGFLPYMRDQIMMSRHHPATKRYLLTKFLSGFIDSSGRLLVDDRILKATSYDPRYILPTVIVPGHSHSPGFSRDMEDLEYIALSWDAEGRPPFDVEDCEKYARREMYLAHKIGCVTDIPELHGKVYGPWAYLSWAIEQYGGISKEQAGQFRNIIGLYRKLAARSDSLNPAFIKDLGTIIHDLEKTLEIARIETPEEEAVEQVQENERTAKSEQSIEKASREKPTPEFWLLRGEGDFEAGWYKAACYCFIHAAVACVRDLDGKGALWQKMREVQIRASITRAEESFLAFASPEAKEVYLRNTQGALAQQGSTHLEVSLTEQSL